MPALTISGCCLACAPSEAASCKPSASAWPTQSRLGARAVQWVAAGQAKTSRAEPATAAAATRAALFRNADTIADSVRCREAAPGRAGENRGGLRCRASVQDTIGPSVGRGERAQLPPGVPAWYVPSPSGVRMLRGLTATVSRETPHAGCCQSTRLHHWHVSPGRNYATVRGHEKVPVCGQVEVLAGGQLKVPIPRSPCRGAGNNRAVSTATASSFLNAAGRLGG